MKRVYMKCKDGMMRTWRVNILIRLLWRMRDGWFTLRGGRYRIDPEKYQARVYWPFGVIPIERVELCLAYKEGDSEPVSMFAERDGDPSVSPSALEAVTESAALRALLPAPIPWVLIIVLLAVVGLFMLMGALA